MIAIAHQVPSTATAEYKCSLSVDKTQGTLLVQNRCVMYVRQNVVKKETASLIFPENVANQLGWKVARLFAEKFSIYLCQSAAKGHIPEITEFQNFSWL